MNNKKIAIIGLGYVGLPIAIEFGKRYSTLGYDINRCRIKELKLFKDITLEISEENIRNAKKLSFSCESKDLGKCNIFIVTVPTPIDDLNKPDLNSLIEATKLVAKYIKSDDITCDNIIPRKPLSNNAKRAGWQGCNLHFTNIHFITPAF